VPHLTIEYSANVEDHHDIAALVDAVHLAALEHGLPAVDALRTRAVRRELYRIADGGRDYAFVAIWGRIAPGRDDHTKQTFCSAVLDAAEASVASVPGPLAIAWSVALSEIDPTARLNRNHVRERMAARDEGADR